MATVLDPHLSELRDLCRRYAVARLDLFGSATNDSFDPERSDLDFLVEFEDLPPVQYAEAYFSLKESLESLFGRRVDLLTEASLENPYLRARVYQEREQVYAR